MIRKLLIPIIIAGILLSGCPQKNPEIVPNVTQKDSIELCAPACVNVKYLGCFEGQDLVFPDRDCVVSDDCKEGYCKNGKCTETCEMTCEALVKEGRQLGLDCWTQITRCSQIESVCR